MFPFEACKYICLQYVDQLDYKVYIHALQVVAAITIALYHFLITMALCLLQLEPVLLVIDIVYMVTWHAHKTN